MEEQMSSPGRDFPGVGVGGVVVKDAKVLLFLRKKPPESGFWTIPGGAIEFGETVKEALFRELREEVGVDTCIRAYLGVTDHILPDERVHWVSLRFLVDIVADEPKNASPESHSEMRWFPISDVPDNITLTTRKALEAYAKWTEGSNPMTEYYSS